jgi:hypothetical protein
MATDFRTSDDTAFSQSTSPDDDLPLFRFRLRHLLAFVTFACLLLAAMVIWQGITALVLLLATLVIGFHLLSTALGSQLRVHANRIQHRDLPEYLSQVPRMALDTIQSNQPSKPTRSPWHERRSTPLPWLPKLVVSASFLGGILGAILLDGAVGDHTSAAGVAVGSVSMAVVAGWIAFVGYSFYGVFRHGLRDAMNDDRRDHSA